MASTVRDLYLAVRVTDRATGPLRRISSDLRRLSSGGAAGAAGQRERLLARQQANVLKQQRLIKSIESATLPTGAKRAALTERIVNQREKEAKALSSIDRKQRAIAANQVAQGRAAARVARIEAQPDIDAAERRRLQENLRTAKRAQSDLAAHERVLTRNRIAAERTLASHSNVRYKTTTNLHKVEQQITANLAAQERSRAQFSKLAEEQIPMGAMRAMGRGPVPPSASAAERAGLLHHKALLQEEAVLQRRLNEARVAVADLPAKEASAITKVNQAQNALTANKNKQLVSTRKIADLERAVAAAPTRGRSALALQKDLQEAQLAQQELIKRESTLQRDLRTAVSSRANLHIANQRIIADEQELARQTQTWRNELLRTQGKISENSREISRLNQVEQRYLSQQNLAKWSTRTKAVEHLGHAFALIGLASTAALGLAAKSAADFQTQTSLAATQAREPGAPVARTAQISSRVQRSVLQQMKQFPATAEEMSQAFYDIFSGTNIDQVGKAAQLLRVFNKEAVAGGTDLDTMVQAGITLYNNFPGQFHNATLAGNKFFAMVRYGRGTAAQFAQALNPIIPIAHQAGQTFDDVSTTLAYLSRQNQNVTQVSQGYARVLLLLARPEVRAGFKRIGVDVTDSHGRIRNLLNIVQDLNKRFKETPVQALTFFKTISQQATGKGTAGTIQAQRVWGYLVQGAKQYGAVSKLVLADQQNEFQKAFGAQAQTPGVRWAVFINQLRALALEIGTQAIPAFAKMGHYVQLAVHWFDSLSPHTKRMIGYFGAFIAVGSLLGGVLLTIVGGLGSLYVTLRLLMGARALAGLESTAATGSRALGGLGAEAGFVGLRFALAMPLVGGLLYLLYRYPSAFAPVVSWIHRATNEIGGLTHALILLTVAMSARTVLTRGGAFKKLGLEAAQNAGMLTALRLSLLRLGAIGAIAISIMFVFDEKFRHGTEKFIGDFVHGRMDWQVHLDNWLSRMRNRWQKNMVGFIPGIHIGAPKIRLTRAQDREWSQRIQEQQAAQSKAFDKVQILGRARATQLAAPARGAAVRAGIQFTPKFENLYNAFAKARAEVRKTQRALNNASSFSAYNRAANLAAVATNALSKAQKNLSVYLSHHQNAAVRRFVSVTQAAEQLGATKITPSFMQLFQNLLRTRKLANLAQRALELSPTAANSRKALRAWEAYQAALTALQNNATKQQVAAATKVAGATDAAQKKSLEKQKQNIRDTISSVDQMYQDLLQRNQELFGQLFQGPQSALIEFRKSWGVGPRPGDLLKDIRGQVYQFQRFQRLLNRLRAQGAPPELINQIRQQGISALPDLIALTRMQPGQWKQYLNAFKEGQKLIKQQTWRDLQDQLSLYRKFGKNVGQAIQRGIADETPQLKAEIRRLVLRMFPELKRQQRQTQQQQRPHNPPHHPPRRAPHRPRHTPAPAPHHNGTGDRHKHTHYHDHTAIHTTKTESLESVLAKHRNRMRNRPRYGH